MRRGDRTSGQAALGRFRRRGERRIDGFRYDSWAGPDPGPAGRRFSTIAGPDAYRALWLHGLRWMVVERCIGLHEDFFRWDRSNGFTAERWLGNGEKNGLYAFM